MASKEGAEQQTCEDSPFLLLPPQLLEQGICQHLGIVDRVRLLSTCKQLWESGQLRNSPVLWGRIAADLQSLPQAEAFVRWLATKRGLVLSLSMASSLRADDSEAWQQECQEVYGCMETALSALAGGPLQQLRLEPSGSVEVRSWVLSGLPNLQSLILNLGMEASVQLGADFSQLTALTQLAVGAGDAKQLEQGSLPAGLKRLALYGLPAASSRAQLELALSGVECLQELHLTGRSRALGAFFKGGAGAGAAVESACDRLGSLTRLTLMPEIHPMPLPEAITALTNLQRLELQQCPSQRYMAPGALQPLTALTRLTFLSLAGWLLEEWPAQLQALPRLKALKMAYTCFPAPDPGWPVWGRLEALCLPLSTAACSLQQLGQLTSLTFLELDARKLPRALTSCEDSAAAAGLLQVLPAAARLPRLLALTMTDLGRFERKHRDVMEARQQLCRCKPWLVINGENPMQASCNDFERFVFARRYG